MNLGPAWGYSSSTTSYFDPENGSILQTGIVYGEYYAPPNYPQFVDGDELTLQGLFKWRGERIDPIADATIESGHVFPGCGFKAELVLAGGSCDLALGWYNFTGPGAPPTRADIQPLVPRGSTYLNDTTGAHFVPLGWDNRNPRNLSTLNWTPQAIGSGDITSDIHYTGGDIGFALLSDPNGQCKSDKFSVYEHNVKNSSGVPWVTSIAYRSTKDPTAIYLAFEDLPMSVADWHGAGSQYTNDGDFNDAVYFISGLGATSACPDPACAKVVCDPNMTCSSGSCVPLPASDGSAGAGDGGASGSHPGNEAGGAAGGAGSGPTPGNEAAGRTADADGGVTGATDDATPGTSSAGAESEPGGAGSGGTAATSKGCGCRVGSKSDRSPAPWLGLALVGAALRRRRVRNQRSADAVAPALARPRRR